MIILIMMMIIEKPAALPALCSSRVGRWALAWMERVVMIVIIVVIVIMIIVIIIVIIITIRVIIIIIVVVW